MISARPLCFVVLGGALVLAVSHSSWTAERNAEASLREAASKYTELESYTIEFVRYDETGASHSVHHRRISFLRPSYYRIEELEPLPQSDGEPANASACVRTTDIIDGKHRWTYSTDLQQYSNRPIDLGMENPAVQLGLYLPEGFQDVEFAPDQIVSLGGTRYDCTVVLASGSNGSTMRYWIDKAREVPVR